MRKPITTAMLLIAASIAVISCSKKDADPIVPAKTCNLKAMNILSPVANESGKVVYEVKATGDVTTSKITYYITGTKKIEVKTVSLPFKDSATVNARDSIAIFVDAKATNGKITASLSFKGKTTTTTASDECSGYNN